MPDVAEELAALMKIAKRENYTEAQKVLAGHLKEIRDERLRRPWPMGRCIWCEIDANRLREATIPDPSGGPAMCEQHFDEMHAEAARAEFENTGCNGTGRDICS